MSNEEHTKGPWRIQREQLSPLSSKEGFTIITESFDIVSGHLAIRKEADAKLIAAAPDLLEALKAAKEHLEYYGYGDSWERECAIGLPTMIEYAITKATGKEEK